MCIQTFFQTCYRETIKDFCGFYKEMFLYIFEQSYDSYLNRICITEIFNNWELKHDKLKYDK